MAKGKDPHSEMAHARKTDGIDVIFDKNSPASSRSRSRSSNRWERDSSSDSSNSRGRSNTRRRNRSSSSSSSSTSSSSHRSSRPRSRSHPRCYRPSSRCRCDNHRRYGRSRYHRSPPRRYRAQRHSNSRSPSSDRYSSSKYRKSQSRSVNSWGRHSRAASRSSQSSFRAYRSRSRSRSSERSVRLSLSDKKELLKAAQDNAKKILGLENLDLPESVKPILPEQPVLRPEPETRVTHHLQKIVSQSSDEEPDDVPSPKLSAKGKISFSINNSVVKPTVVAPSLPKVTPRVDSYESRKPYGHWVPVKSGRTSRKHSS